MSYQNIGPHCQNPVGNREVQTGTNSIPTIFIPFPMCCGPPGRPPVVGAAVMQLAERVVRRTHSELMAAQFCPGSALP